MRNLAVPADHPEAELVTTIDGQLQTVTCGALTVYRVGGMEVSELDGRWVGLAVNAMPSESDRHDALADGMRERAGTYALQVTDAMVRARLLDYVDGWAAVLGVLIDQTSEGSLYDAVSPDIVARLLCVMCPSTSRRYVLLVPEGMHTVSEARRWVNRDIGDLEIET